MNKLYYKLLKTITLFIGTLILLFWFAPQSQAQTYCIPIYSTGCLFGDDISNVTLEGETITLNNSTTACSANAYQDYTSLANPDLAPGNTYTISISTSYPSPGFEDVRAWIDYNNNGTFEATETIANTNGNGMAPGTVSYDFTVPTGTAAGDYRLRVRLVYSSSDIDPCASDYYGETEDYTVTVISLSPCAGAPSAGTTIPDFDICALTPFNISTLNASAPAAGLDSKWQSSPEGANIWTDIAGANSVNFNITAGITAATDYRFLRTCINSNLSDTSDVLTVTLSPGTSCYCEPVYDWGCSNGARVDGVTTTFGLTNISNTGTGCTDLDATGYSDYSATHSASAAHSTMMNVKVDVGNYAGGVKVWIDWNQNGIFEASEMVAESPATIPQGSFYQADFMVPPTAVLGDTKMRVRVVESSTVFGPCTTEGYGEAEDYGFTVLQGTACSGMPVIDTIQGPTEICALTPFTLTMSPILMTDVTYLFQESPLGQNTWTAVTGGNSFTHTFTNGITTPTDYRLIVTCTNSNLSDTTDVHGVTIAPGTSCYCDPVYNWGCNIGAQVGGVTTTLGLTNISNIGTGCNELDATGYTDFSATHSASAAHSTQMTVKVDVANYSGGVKVWIDWNQNGIFEPSELIGESTSTITPGNFYQTNFMVPATAATGTTKMRVRVAESTTVFDPCSVGGYGEAEDYGFTVLQGTVCSGVPNIDVVQGPNEVCASVPFTISMSPLLVSDIVYQWQSSPLGLNTWANIAGATNFSYNFTAGITTATDYRLIVTCTNSNLSDTTNVHGITILPPSECYCIPSSSNSSYFVDSFSTTGGVRNVNNGATGWGPSGYQNFAPTDTIAQVQTQDVSFHIKGNTTSTAGAKIWVDWNKNGIFDANEQVFASTSYANVHTGTFEVPMTAVAGVTRLRIGWHGFNSTGPAGPCENNINGEYEDYAFEVIALQDCSSVSTPSGWEIVFNKDSICLVGDISMSVNEQIYASNVTYQFQQSTNGVTWTNIGSPSLTPQASVDDVDEETQFRVIWLCNNVGIDTAVGTVYVVDPQIATTTDGTRCGPGTVTLNATTLSGGEIRWYDDNLGTNLLGTGNDFITPSLTNSATYWAAAGLGGSGNNDTLHTLSTAGNGCTGGAMFNLTPTDDLQIDSLTALATGSGSEVKVYYREGGYVGFNQNATAWTLHETLNVSYAAGNVKIPLTNPLELTANTTYGIYVFYNASYTNGTPANSTYSNADLLFEGGDGLCSEFGGANVGRIFNGTIHYSLVGCESDLVAVEAVVNDNPVVSLGGNLAACQGHVFTLDAGPGFDSYLWSDNSTGQTLDVTTPGIYTVEVSLGDCTASDQVTVGFYDAPVSVLDAEIIACDGELVTLDAGNAGPNSKYLWSTGDTTQIINVEDPGTYTVNIFNGACDIDDQVVVTIIEQSTGQSIHNTELGERLFQFYVVNPVNVESYFWDFGDGNTSTDEQPIHEYLGFGSYDVTVQLSQQSCFEGDSLMRHIVVRSVDIDELVKADKYVRLYPNPASNAVTIELEEELQMKSVMIQDITGRVIMERQFEETTSRVNLSTQSLASGIYQVVIDTNEGRFTRKLEIIK